MPDERSKVLHQAADHFDERVDELEEIARRYGHQDIGAPLLRAQAMALREAATYVRTLAVNGQAQAPKARKPRKPKEAKVSEPQTPIRPQPVASRPGPPPPPLPTGA